MHSTFVALVYAGAAAAVVVGLRDSNETSGGKESLEEGDELALLALRGGKAAADPAFKHGGPGQGTQDMLFLNGVQGSPKASQNYPQYEGFTLTLVEEFDKPIDLDKDPIWTWSDGGLGEGQVRFTKEGITFKDGKMFLTVTKKTVHGGCSHAEVSHVGTKKLQSGELRTKYNMFRYGRYEARMKAPSVQKGDFEIDGNYIATMFIYRDAKFKHWREVDIEVLGQGKDYVTSNLLYADNTRGWSPSIQVLQEGHHKPADGSEFHARKNFNDYAVEWTPDSLKWFVNGEKVREYKYDGKKNKVKIPDKAGKIMMNLWIFGTGYHFGGKKGKNNRYDDFHTEYEWFRFYKYNGDKKYPCPGLKPDCLSNDDKYFSSNNPCDGLENKDHDTGKKAKCHGKCGGHSALLGVNETDAEVDDVSEHEAEKQWAAIHDTMDSNEDENDDGEKEEEI